MINPIWCDAKNICMSNDRHILLPLRIKQRFALLLLHRLFHADRVGHQLQVAQDLGLFSLDVAFDRCVGQQLGQVAFGHHQVEQV